MKLECFIERERFGTFVVPIAADAGLIIKNIFILCGESNIISCFGIIRFCFREVFTSGKEKNKTEQNKNNFFQNNASFQMG